MTLATSAETAVVEDLIERIGISETLNLLAAVCAVKSFVEDDKDKRQQWSNLGVLVSDAADSALDTVSEG
jgi:HD-like signal output (HDOD) protein